MGSVALLRSSTKQMQTEISSHYQFPADENVRQQWIVVRSKREPSSWTPGSGHICSAHFTDNSYEGFRANLAGFSICTLFY